MPLPSRRCFSFILASLTLTYPLSAQQSPSRPPPKSTTVVVFAAASLKTALDKAVTQWTLSTGQTATLSYAASGALVKQIDSGAPADIFASADLKWMDDAAEKKLIDPQTRADLFANTLVLIAPKDAPTTLKIEPGFKLAEAIGDGKLATGAPKSVPAGAYAQAALTTLGVWPAVSPKIAGAESVRAALAFVARGEAPFGIVYQTDANSEPKVKVVATFPASSHPPIVYPFAITAASKNPAAANLLTFLKSPDAAAIFTAEGFTVQP